MYSLQMERISAASAMEWSIQLEKALRSKKPGRSIEAIQQIGERIQQWGKEPKPTMAVYNMFGLIPGEDRLFANTILLRLADAFRLGDKETRLSVVRVFQLQLKNRGKMLKTKRYKGILSKDRVHNHLELLKRVKIVFDTGDVESRAMALVLFGCWADFAKDSAHIRYLILSSMVSSDVLEVKASLFAAGCFCELAGDFASVVLEMLLNLVASSETSSTIRLAGVRVFAKMGVSYSVANRAYKLGVKLVLDSLEEDFVVAMLVSLSKLASKSILLVEQVDLLLSFLSQENALQLKATALRCLRILFLGAVFHSCASEHAIKTLSRIVDDTGVTVPMQCEALQILDKMLLCRLSNLPQDMMIEFGSLLTTIEKFTQSSIKSKSLLAVHVLADISMKLSRRTEMGSVRDICSPSPSRIIEIIIDRVFWLVKPLLNLCQTDGGVFQEVRNLLSLLLSLVREYPDLGVLVLDKIRSLIEYLADAHECDIATGQTSLSVSEMVDFRGENSFGISLKLVHYVHKFCVTCIETLNEAGAITTQVVDKVKLLAESLHCCSSFHLYAHTIYSLLLHSQIIWNYVVNKNKGSCNPDGNLDSALFNRFVEHEIFTLECAKKMLTERDNWSAYKAGTFAVCHGAWVTAAFTFQQLTGKVQSETCSCWLRSLVQFAQTETRIQLFLLPKLSFSLESWSKKNGFSIILLRENFEEIGQDAVEKICVADYKVLLEAHHGICSSRKTLESIVTSDNSFCFQRWFSSLRGEVLETVANVLRVLDTIPLKQDCNSNNGQVLKTDECLNSLQQIVLLCFRLKRLGQEYDLIVMSFIGMDSKSAKIISTIALSCSLLAFATGFTISMSNLPANETLMPSGVGNSSDCLQGMLVHDLVRRLWLIDQDACSSLGMLLDVVVQPKECFHLQPRSRMLNTVGEERDILNVCNYVVSAMVALKNEANRNHNEGILYQVTRAGLQLILNTITKWMHIPFRVPKYFFKIRPCIGSELFVFSGDARNSNQLSVLSGFNLSLNLCLQLRNLQQDLAIRVTRSYCILYSSMSFQEHIPSAETKGQMQLDYGAWEIDNMIQMNEKLLHHVTECTKKTSNGKRGRDKDDVDDDGLVIGYVCFELDDKRQGFSNCLLDVSHFPVGSYRIKWQSCCIDSEGYFWCLLPLNTGPVFTVQKPPAES